MSGIRTHLDLRRYSLAFLCVFSWRWLAIPAAGALLRRQFRCSRNPLKISFDPSWSLVDAGSVFTCGHNDELFFF